MGGGSNSRGSAGSGGGSGLAVQQASGCPVCFDMFSFPAFGKQKDLQVAHQESIKLRGKCDPRRLTTINFYYYK